MAEPSMSKIALTVPAPRLPPAILSAEQVAQLLWLTRVADRVELKFSVSEVRGLAVAALGLDPFENSTHYVTFFDTPDLTLFRSGVLVWIRRRQHNRGELVIELPSVTPDRLPCGLRGWAGFGVKVEAVPGGFACSVSVMAPADTREAEEAMAGRRPLQTLLTNEQYRFLSVNAPHGFRLGGLTMLGPIILLKLGSGPAGLRGRMATELWNHPNGSQVLELSTRCDPAEAFYLAAETRGYLLTHGIDLVAPQDVTRTALELLRNQHAGVTASSSS